MKSFIFSARKVIAIAIILVTSLNLTACQWFSGAGTTFTTFAGIKIPDGTPAFQAGFRDGCSSNYYARGNQLFRHMYGYRYDPKLSSNPEYRFGHQRGYTWCFSQMVGVFNQSSFDRFIYGYWTEGPFDMSSGDINNAWGGFFGGSEGKGLGEPIGEGFNPIFGLWSGGGSGALSANPLWAGGSVGQIFGQPRP